MDFADLLLQCVHERASDLHLSSGCPPFIRVDGKLRELPLSALSQDDILELLYSVICDDANRQLLLKVDFDFTCSVANIARLRVNVFYEKNGMAVAVRLISNTIPSLVELGLPRVIQTLLDVNYGLVIVAGATGSGKSTTLASMIDHLNVSNAKHIITIEDPIEFHHQNKKSLVHQRQLHRDTKDMSLALRSALREDPDVIMLGEIRDLETMRLVLTASETGHLVLATLHANSAPGVIHRIIDVFPANEKNLVRNMLAESLQAVLCQKLIPQEPSGRKAAFEIMIATPAIRHLIREDKISQMHSVIQTSRDAGMVSMEQSLTEMSLQVL